MLICLVKNRMKFWEEIHQVEELKKQVESKREQMIQVIKNNGIGSQKALQISQELDTLIAEYQKMYTKCH